MTREWLDEFDDRVVAKIEAQLQEYGIVHDCPICGVDVAPGEMEAHNATVEHLEKAREFWGFYRFDEPFMEW